MKQYKDTRYWLEPDGSVYRLSDNGKYLKMKGCYERDKGRVRYNFYGKKYEATRIMWETFRGEIPKGYVVYHKNGCFTCNDISNLGLCVKSDCNIARYHPRTRKVIDLDTRRIIKGVRKASKMLKVERKTLTNICNGKSRKKLNVAWYDDVNGKPFRCDYEEYFNKNMRKEYEQYKRISQPQ